jgi:acetyl esterase/lipase
MAGTGIITNKGIFQMKIYRFIFGLFIGIILITACSYSPFNFGNSQIDSPTSVPSMTPQPLGEGVARKIDHDITYCTVDNVDLKLDLYFPKNIDSPASTVVYVHGGAWMGQDKTSTAGEVDLPFIIDSLINDGFIVGAVNYRLAPQFKFPAMIEDVKCAVRFLRANADEYNINPNKIGAWGGSAGGHLVNLLGTTDSSAGFDVGQYLDQSSRVEAVADLFGHADLPAYTKEKSHVWLLKTVFGTFNLTNASPVTYITPDDPPFLILHGDADQSVPLDQSQEFYNKLTAAGIPAQLIIVHGGPHGLDASNESPSPSQLSQMIVGFFIKYLK